VKKRNLVRMIEDRKKERKRERERERERNNNGTKRKE
jgi:hypothetical protein